MSVRYDDAQTYVARALGNASDADQLAAAADSIKAALNEWNLRRDWRYLNMDTSGGFSVAACTTALNNTAVTTTTANGFAAVNVGVAVSGGGIPAGTTVAAVSSSTALTLSANATNGAIVSLTFAGDIPLVAGTAVYNLPSPVKRIYDARFTVNERVLIWKDQRDLDRMFGSTFSARGTPEYYNTFNPTSFSASGAQNGVIRLYRTPDATDTLRVGYYRPIAEPSSASDKIDTLDRYVYALLDLAKYYYMRDHDADNPRTGDIEKRAEKLFRECWKDDDEGSEDADLAFVPRMEHDLSRRFDPDVPFGGV